MPETQTPSERMKNYRAKLRAQGLRPIQIWVPDVNAPGFREQLRKDIQSLNREHEKEILEDFEKVIDDKGWV